MTDLATAQQAAGAAYKAAMEMPGHMPRLTIRKAWDGFVARNVKAQHSPAEMHRIALEAERVMRGFAELAPDARKALAIHERSVSPHLSLGDAREAMRSVPALAEYQAAQDAAAEAARLAHIASAELAAKVWHRERPGLLLKELRQRGIEVSLDRDGNLTVPPGTALSPSELAEVRERKADIAAILVSEAPVVIA